VRHPEKKKGGEKKRPMVGTHMAVRQGKEVGGSWVAV
jgi:hypothetical protein